MLTSLLQDLRYAARACVRSLGFTIVVVVMLALSIGANTALFSVLNALVLRPLPIREPARLVAISVVDDRNQAQPLIYLRAFEALRARQHVFESMSLHSGGGLLATTVRGVLVDAAVEGVTSELYPMLGVRPIAGRPIGDVDSPSSDAAPAVVVIGYRFWQRRLGGDPRAIGEPLVVDGVPHTIVGVTPPEYHGLYVDGGNDLTMPIAALRRLAGDPRLPLRGWNVIARLRAGVSVEQARAEIVSLWPSIRSDTMPPGLTKTQQDQMRSLRMTVESLAGGFSTLRTRYASPLAILVGMTCVLLAIGCANVSGLLLARAVRRDQQIAIRIALGASRGRLVQAVIVESLLLSSAGTALALPFAWSGSRWLGAMLWASSDRALALSMTPDPRVLSAAIAIAVVGGLLLCVLPAWLTTSDRGWIDLRNGRTVTSGRAYTARALLVAQVALSMILVFGAGLFARSLLNVRGNESSFTSRAIVWGRMWLKPGIRPAALPPATASYFLDIDRQLSEIAGVESVGFSMTFPGLFNMTPRTDTIALDTATATVRAEAIADTVSPAFFSTLGIARLAGRDFTWKDDGASPAVGIVNISLARKLFGGESAIGRTVRIGARSDGPAVEIVGVVEDAPMGNIRQPHAAALFRPLLQEPQRARIPNLLVRTVGDVKAAGDAMKTVVTSAGPNYMRGVTLFDEHVAHALLQERLLAALASVFAALAILVASIGLYGRLSYAAACRTREIGVRMALGATRFGVVWMIVSEGLFLAIAGIVVGVPCALATGRLTRSFLYGLAPSDPTALATAGAVFILVAIAAAWLPAYRAASIDPTAALRQE